MATAPGVTVAAVLAAVAAGACFAISNVLQQRAARSAPKQDNLRPRLLLDLARRGDWWAAIVVAAASFGFQALALASGPLALVQPLIVTDLLFALPLAARLGGRRLRRREWTGAALVVAGLATFLTAGSPTAGIDEPSLAKWLPILVAVPAVVLAAMAVASRRPGLRRTSMLAVSAGLAFGLMSALTKAVVELFMERGLGAVMSWQPWAMGVAAVTGLLFSQSAFQCGSISVTLPLMDILEPLVAVGIAVVVFDEHIGFTPVALCLELLGGLAVAAGVVTLDRSRLVRPVEPSVPPTPAGQPVPKAPKQVEYDDLPTAVASTREPTRTPVGTASRPGDCT